MKHTFLSILSAITISYSINAEEHCHLHASAAPVSVMGNHTHAKGDLMVSYRYAYMSMDGMAAGRNDISSSEVFSNNYTVAPTYMDMRMHMLGMMYAPTDQLTLMAMAAYKTLDMSHDIFPMAAPLINLNGGETTFKTRSSGIGDLKLSGLYQVYKKDHSSMHLTMGISLPTGSIDEQDTIPGPGGRINRILPAAMQLGSGTYDLLPAITYLGRFDKVSYGAQASGVIRLGENDRGFTYGNEFALATWLAYPLVDELSSYLQLRYKWQDELSGTQEGVSQSPPFAPARRTVTTAFNENYGRQIIELGWGINAVLANNTFGTHRISAEVLTPLWQEVNGLQLEIDYTLVLGYQFSF